jgi:hypothetical protein
MVPHIVGELEGFWLNISARNAGAFIDASNPSDKLLKIKRFIKLVGLKVWLRNFNVLCF